MRIFLWVLAEWQVDDCWILVVGITFNCGIHHTKLVCIDNIYNTRFFLYFKSQKITSKTCHNTNNYEKKDFQRLVIRKHVFWNTRWRTEQNDFKCVCICRCMYVCPLRPEVGNLYLSSLGFQLGIISRMFCFHCI